ncbi:hypothetical protein RDWZM_010498 [Blomia tropicalis]|uniref:Uncharacterized protein n=1 Tax=Blomia tropicalis TaxID=40697 RepID=A0A9Q0LZK8_BLOTA|nr:hypothetical protein RDWZM_010498 [Blomia tropicalis]
MDSSPSKSSSSSDTTIIAAHSKRSSSFEDTEQPIRIKRTYDDVEELEKTLKKWSIDDYYEGEEEEEEMEVEIDRTKRIKKRECKFCKYRYINPESKYIPDTDHETLECENCTMADPMIKNFKNLAKMVHEMRNANSHNKSTSMKPNTKVLNLIKLTKRDINNALKYNVKINIDLEIKALEKILNGLKMASKKIHNINFNIGIDFAGTLLISAQNYKKDPKQNTFLKYLEKAFITGSEALCAKKAATIGSAVAGPVGKIGGYLLGHMTGEYLSKSLIEQTLTLFDN